MAALLVFAQPCFAEDEDVPAPVSCGKDTVVFFDRDKSADGRFALGWTIRPIKKDAKPVDWSQYSKKGISLVDDYPHEDWTGQNEIDFSYVIVDGIVDLSGKSFKDLPLPNPFYTNGNHGWSIHAAWVGKNEAVIIVDSRFETSDLLLLRMSKGGLSAIDLMPKANQKVEKLIAEKRPLTNDMSIMYDSSEIVLRDEVFRLPFTACHPKGSQEDLDGTLFLSQKDGTPVRVECNADTPEDRPFTGQLGTADKRLNEIYSSLRKSLMGEAREQLVAGQREWINLRNKNSRDAAEEKVPFFQEDSTREAYLAIRNQEALKLTRERVDTLQKQLAAITRN